LGEKAIITLIISVVVVNCGVLFENRPWIRYAEWIRIGVYPLLLSAAVYLYSLPSFFYGAGALYLFISAFWFGRIDKQLKLTYAQIA
jgi:hypothetical protein